MSVESERLERAAVRIHVNSGSRTTPQPSARAAVTTAPRPFDAVDVRGGAGGVIHRDDVHVEIRGVAQQVLDHAAEGPIPLSRVAGADDDLRPALGSREGNERRGDVVVHDLLVLALELVYQLFGEGGVSTVVVGLLSAGHHVHRENLRPRARRDARRAAQEHLVGECLARRRSVARASPRWRRSRAHLDIAAGRPPRDRPATAARARASALRLPTRK